MIRQLFGFLIVCLLTCVGCGGPDFGTPVKVTGKVSVSGAPPKDVRIIFQANDGKLTADKRIAKASVNADGTFTMDNVYPAEYTVLLESSVPPPADPGSAMAVPNTSLPVDQNGQVKTLTAKVPTDKNDFTFDF